jgi:hypothetical protein
MAEEKVEDMSRLELMAKAVSDVNTVVNDEDLNTPIIPGLIFATNSWSGHVTLDVIAMNEDDFSWDGEEEGDPRYGKSEYECMLEDIEKELGDQEEALHSLRSAVRKVLDSNRSPR